MQDKVTIDIASMNGTSCGPYGLKRGETYLVYGYANERDEKILYTGVCTRTVTTSSKYAKEDFDFLRNLPATGTGGNIRGRIWADLKAGGATPLLDVRVIIRNAGSDVITVYTDKNGEFEVKQLKPGKYTVEPDLPANYFTENKSAEVRVDDRGTADVGFEAYIDGSISGHVFDSEGSAYNSIFLHLVGGDKSVYGHSTQEDGGFIVQGTPPGEYILYIELRHADHNKNTKYYYPGTFQREKAVPIRVGLGEKVVGLKFQLPDGFSVRTVEGQVMFDNGKPGAGVDVILLCPQSAQSDGLAVEFTPTLTRTDEQGQFRLEGFTGEVYWIEARGSRESDKKGEFIEMHSPSKRLDLRENLKNVKLVLSETGHFGAGCPK